MTPLMPAEGVANADRCITDHAEEGVEEGSDTNVDAEAAFPGSSRVTNMGSIVTTILVNDKIRSNRYREGSM